MVWSFLGYVSTFWSALAFLWVSSWSTPHAVIVHAVLISVGLFVAVLAALSNFVSPRLRPLGERDQIRLAFARGLLRPSHAFAQGASGAAFFIAMYWALGATDVFGTHSQLLGLGLCALSFFTSFVIGPTWLAYSASRIAACDAGFPVIVSQTRVDEITESEN